MLLASYAADLEDIDEVSIKQDLDREVDRSEVEVFEGEPVEEDFRRQQLFAANVDRVLRQIKGITQTDVAGGQFYARGKCLLRSRRKHHGAMSADAQFQMTKEPRVVVKEANIRRARWINVTRDTGGAEGLSIDQS